MKTVSVTLADLPPLSPERIAELRALAERPDSEIDYSDIPAQDPADWVGAEHGRFYRPLKKDDPRQCLQLPTEAITSGLEPNPREGNNHRIRH